MLTQARERAAAAALAPAPAQAPSVAVEAAGGPMYEVYVGAEQAPAGAPVVTVGSAGQVEHSQKISYLRVGFSSLAISHPCLRSLNLMP